MKPVLLVTGASRGIGAATAVLAAQRGWRVVVNYSNNRAAADDVARQIQQAGSEALVVQADVSDEAQIMAMFQRIDSHWGRLDGLVNNAGVVDVQSRVDDMTLARLERMFRLNVIGSFLCAREAVRRMSTRHGHGGGVIVNLSSAASRLGGAGQYVDYAASKGAIDSRVLLWRSRPKAFVSTRSARASPPPRSTPAAVSPVARKPLAPTSP